MGVGSAPFYTTVVCYIDDTVADLNSVFFVGWCLRRIAPINVYPPAGIYIAVGQFGDFCGTFVTPFFNLLPGG